MLNHVHVFSLTCQISIAVVSVPKVRISHVAVAGSSHLDFSCLLTEGCWAQNMEYDGILAIFWIVKRVRMKLFFDLKQLCGSIIPRRAPNTSRTLEALFTPYKFSGRLDSSFNKINALGKLKKKNKTVK